MLSQPDLDYLEQQLPFWPRLTAAETRLIQNSTRLLHYRTGEIIYSAARECIGVLLVKSGELRTYILSEDGREITLFRGQRGHVCILSASCLLKSISFEVNIAAEQATDVLLIEAEVFARLQERHEYVENFALKIAAGGFSDVIWVLEQICFMRFDRRLALFLLDEAARTGQRRLALTHEKIAQYMGSAREVVSRMLKYFEREGLVALHRGGVELLDREALNAVGTRLQT